MTPKARLRFSSMHAPPSFLSRSVHREEKTRKKHGKTTDKKATAASFLDYVTTWNLKNSLTWTSKMCINRDSQRCSNFCLFLSFLFTTRSSKLIKTLFFIFLRRSKIAFHIVFYVDVVFFSFFDARVFEILWYLMKTENMKRFSFSLLLLSSN